MYRIRKTLVSTMVLVVGPLAAGNVSAAAAMVTSAGLPTAESVVANSGASLPRPVIPAPSGNITGAVIDSASGRPIPSAEVAVRQGGHIVAVTTSDALGQYQVRNLNAGTYTVVVRLLGFAAVTRTATLSENSGAHVDFELAPVAVALAGQQITAGSPISIDVRAGNQRFKQDAYHGSPMNTTSQIIQQSIAGAVKAPTGEVHIRGQHAEYTYYVDGVPVPAGISGSLNELFDPSVVSQIDFITGAWDAEYGDKNAAIVNVTTRIPAGDFHANIAGYGGNYNTNGQSANVNGNKGKFGYFFSGARQETGMRQEPHLFDSTAFKVVNLNNRGEDVFGFGKLQYSLRTSDVINLEGNLSRTRFQIPSDTAVVVNHDRQQDVNGFLNLGWTHRFGLEGAETPNGATPPQLFAGLFYRNGTLSYTPGASDPPAFQFGNDSTLYNLRENRRFNVVGVKLDYSIQARRGLNFKFGTLSSITRGREDFTTFDSIGGAGPASNSNIQGHDISFYAQTIVSPIDKFELHLGVRYDGHKAPFADNQTQVSPRVRLNFFPTAQDNFYVYYGKQFLPTNVEDLYALTSLAQGGIPGGAVPTLPERDNFYEAGYLHRFPIGVVAKISGYHKDSKPGIDDATIGNSRVLTSVNIGQVHVTGIESVIEVRPAGPFSGYVNLALNHAWGEGAISGGFFPPVTDAGRHDLDHDQRISATASATYALGAAYFSATEIYGTGLTNSGTVDSTTYSTRLFAFNRDIHVKPYGIASLSAGYSFNFGSSVVRPEVYVDNVFDKQYALKGAFFSPALYGRPRTYQLRVRVGF